MRFMEMKIFKYISIILMLLLSGVNAQPLNELFQNPPDSARPGVYWYFMDGNQDREMMEVDLRSMHAAGLRKALFLEVNIGIPVGPVKFMSEPWQDNFAHAAKVADELGLEIILGTGPGWAGSGGPWVKPEQSMQHLCASTVQVSGPGAVEIKLSVPAPRPKTKFSGLNPPLARIRDGWYKDVAVLAFPTPAETEPPELLSIKALHDVQPYSIMKKAPRFVPSSAEYDEPNAKAVIPVERIVDLTGKMQPDGSLDWKAPPGDWTVMRLAARSTGQTTRPAPAPGHGFEVDKFRADAFQFHFDQFHRKLMDKIGKRRPGRGWTALHLDSWEMSSQNWSENFREAFRKQHGYDPQPFYPALQGLIVGSREQTERFLWDLRRTAQELVLGEYAGTIKRLAHDNGLTYTSQGYDMNPAGDLDLLAQADIPSCEFWINRVDSLYSTVEAVSAAHVAGKPVVRAEAFTSMGSGFGTSPADMKDQTHWAFAMGINDIIFHTFQHQPLGKEEPKPGMTMGPHGIHWHRNQTFWPLVGAYHDYIARCGEILRQGVSVADILYLTPEGAPHIFMAPEDALTNKPGRLIRDKKGYPFDAVSPRILMERAQVKDGLVAFENGSLYRVLVLPLVDTMTPELLAKIEQLVKDGATVIGVPPRKSPSLVGFPQVDEAVAKKAREIWGGIHSGGELTTPGSKDKLYPSYASTHAWLAKAGIPEVVSSDADLRFHQRRTEDLDIFFVANKSAEPIQCEANFRTDGSKPELWNAIDGGIRPLPGFSKADNGTVRIPLQFAAHEGYFVVFDRKASGEATTKAPNFLASKKVLEIPGPWQVRFDPTWGGPEQPVTFTALSDWSNHDEPGIKYYSGIAEYETRFDAPAVDAALSLDLGQVEDLARVTLNGRDLGVVWSHPYRVAIPDGLLRKKDNRLQIEVANTWHNRLVGDQQPGNKDARQLQWENGLLSGKSFAAGRYTFATRDLPKGNTKLQPAGLLGPVQITIKEE